MAYKDILVYLDPTVETVERIRLAVSLAKAHGARLIGVDVSAPAAGQEVETEMRSAGYLATRRASPG